MTPSKEKKAISEENAEGAMDVYLHPMVIVNISDHYTRDRLSIGRVKDQAPSCRVFGLLLGIQKGRRVEIFNSFELLIDRTTNEIDQDYLFTKVEQYKKVFENNEILGWYSTGKQVDAMDLNIHKQMEVHNESPLYLLLNPDAESSEQELPITLLETTVKTSGEKHTPTVMFRKVQYHIETSEAERIAVDHVANVNSTGGSLLTSHYLTVKSATQMLHNRIQLINRYLEEVKKGNIPKDVEVLRTIKALCNNLPLTGYNEEFNKDFLVEYNDTMLVTYLQSITETTNSLNEVALKFNLAHEKHGFGRRGGGGFY